MKGGQNVWEIKLRLAPSHKGEFEKVGDKPRAPKGARKIFFKNVSKFLQKILKSFCGVVPP